jgi:hypothetical protein
MVDPLNEIIFEDGDTTIQLRIELTSAGLSIAASNENGNCFGTVLELTDLQKITETLEDAELREFQEVIRNRVKEIYGPNY